MSTCGGGGQCSSSVMHVYMWWRWSVFKQCDACLHVVEVVSVQAV